MITDKYTAHIINCVTLIFGGAWGYYGHDDKASLLPMFFGLTLLSQSNSIKYENPNIIKAVAVLNALFFSIIVGFSFKMALKTHETLNILRTAAMALTTLWAFVTFVMYLSKRRSRKT